MTLGPGGACSGSLFFEKALLVVAFVFLLTLCLYAPGRAGARGARRRSAAGGRPGWCSPASRWASSRSTCRCRHLVAAPAGVRRRGRHVPRAVLRRTAPRRDCSAGRGRWLDGADGAAVAAPTATAPAGSSWRLVAALVACTLVAAPWRRRPGVAPAAAATSRWSAGLIGATRLGSGVQRRRRPRCRGTSVTCCGRRDLRGRRAVRPAPADADAPGRAEVPAPVRAHRRPYAVGPGTRRCCWSPAASTAASASATDWAIKAGPRLPAAPPAPTWPPRQPGTVFMDQPVPENVVARCPRPCNMQSRFFAPLDRRPGLRHPGPQSCRSSTRPATCDRPGSRACRRRPARSRAAATGSPAARQTPIRLERGRRDYWHAVRIAYISDRDTTAHVPARRRPRGAVRRAPRAERDLPAAATAAAPRSS